MIYLLAGVLAGFLIYIYLLEQRHHSERRELYQRIQAPQQAVATVQAAQAAEDPRTRFVMPDDDESWQNYMNELN